MKINGHKGPLRGKKIEVEVENLREVKEALKAKADIIMLDNMRLREIKRAVEIVGGKALIEVSGKVNQQNIKKIAKSKEAKKRKPAIKAIGEKGSCSKSKVDSKDVTLIKILKERDIFLIFLIKGY